MSPGFFLISLVIFYDFEFDLIKFNLKCFPSLSMLGNFAKIAGQGFFITYCPFGFNTPSNILNAIDIFGKN